MVNKPWTWSEHAHPRVARVFADTETDGEWCDRLEMVAEDPVVGKVLCVCAAVAIARAVSIPNASHAESLDLLSQWIDDPSNERFKKICDLIFEAGPRQELDDITFWPLRTATSTAGNYEAGWALNATCEAAAKAGQSWAKTREIAKAAILARRTIEDTK